MVFLDNFDLDWVVNSVLKEHGGVIDELVLLDEAVEKGWEIPLNWQVEKGWSPSRVTEGIWGDDKVCFPLFANFIEENLSTLFVGRGQWGTCLVYFFTEVNRNSELGYDISMMIGGSPTDPVALQSFELQVGTLPRSLKAFWKIHNYSYFQNNSLLSSLVTSNHSPASNPRILAGIMCNSDAPAEKMDFLAFANVSSPMPLCFIRNLYQVKWDETIFQVDKHGGCFYSDTSCSLDELITRRW